MKGVLGAASHPGLGGLGLQGTWGKAVPPFAPEGGFHQFVGYQISCFPVPLPLSQMVLQKKKVL